MLDADVSYHFAVGDGDVLVFLRGSNLLDEDARRHTSPLKEHAPLPGRSARLGCARSSDSDTDLQRVASKYSAAMRYCVAALFMALNFFSRDPAAADDTFAKAREAMVSEQIEARGVGDKRVLASMRKTPRHRFVPEADQARAYGDHPLPIGEGQTISQPYIVALMTELARPKPSDRALEVGTGSGYQAAVLAPLVKHVCTIELEPELAEQASNVLRELKYENVTTRTGDGYAGWPEHAPFDIIIVTAAPDHVPAPLIEQLKPGGRLVVPVGPIHAAQQLQVIEKAANGATTTRTVTPVRFVPLRRKADE